MGFGSWVLVKKPNIWGYKNKSDIDYSDGLSIEEAKIGLSKKYQIAPENIEIIMKG